MIDTSGYVRWNKKVYSYCKPEEFFDFYNQTSVGSMMIKLDGENYHLTDNGFRKIKDDDVVVFNKNKNYWSKEDNSIISKDKFNSEYELVENMPNINGFLMEFNLYFDFHSMIKVFKKMLKELDNEHYRKNVDLKNQLQWIVNNQDVFLYALS